MTGQQPEAAGPPTKARALRPRDAATLIIVDGASGEPRVLLGRRRADMVFMPGRYVFPGGRVDPADKHIAVEDDLKPGDLKKLMVAMKGPASETRARALALAAVRETFEEAGLLIGTPLGAAAVPKAPTWQDLQLCPVCSAKAGTAAAGLLLNNAAPATSGVSNSEVLAIRPIAFMFIPLADAFSLLARTMCTSPRD